ncbi:MAG: manganese efflux pump MntP family protein [Tissierellia bacterium]|nr:manganese efflux pump MntP family protein [Tissierellia bacterium]
MSFSEILAISFAVAMDAFAISICKGLSLKKTNIKHMVITGLYFGIFQSLMPFIGFILGASFRDLIMSIDHWIAFVILGFLGANMIKEAITGTCPIDPSLTFKVMLPLAIATSIDALAVGITLSLLKVNLVLAISSMGIVTFIFSAIGIKIGNIFGARSKMFAEIIGGVVLILMGCKILVEHLGLLSF